MADELPITDTGPGEDSPTVDDSETDGGQEDTEATQPDATTDPVADADPGTEGTRTVSDAALASCALVEAGFIAALDGDTGAGDLMSRGADSALGSGTDPYPELGQDLIDELGSGDGSSAADRFLNQCASDGFERLAG